MTNYGWKCEGWTEEEKKRLAKALEPLCKENIEPYIEIDRAYQGVRIRKITDVPNQDEFVREVEKIYLKVENEIKELRKARKCILCDKDFEGMGNNAKPLADGRCCDECNLRKVIPARLEGKSLDDLKDAQITTNKDSDSINTDEVFFRGLQIPENDRLKHYQLVKKYWNIKMNNTINEEDLIKKEQMALLRAVWKTSFKASMEEAKVFVIEDDVIPLLLHTDCQDGNLPFPSIFIDAKVQIKNRTYYGFHVGSYYTEKTKYKSILSVYAKKTEYKGEMINILVPDFIILQKTTDEDLPFRKNDYYHNKIRNLIFSFCAFVNEPDVSIITRPVNPKNNVRRIERGLMTLPEYRNVVIRGKLRIYVDNQKKEWQGGTHTPVGYRYWVRGFYRHFFDKKKYATIYALDDDMKNKVGLTFSDKHKEILKKWIKPFIKGQGILIKQSWEVTE